MTTSTRTTTTTFDPKYPLYSCSSNFKMKNAQALSRKGMCVDDTTFQHCPDKMPGLWPNLNHKEIAGLRLFKPWRPEWGDDAARKRAWAALKTWVTTNNAKVLIGAEVTCDKRNDDTSWKLNLELMQLLGKEHILGVAVGNEMDIYWRNHPPTCIAELWNTRYWSDLQSRVADMDKMGFADTKVTIVWAMSVLGGNPWKEDGQARVNTLVTNAYKKWHDRWVWSFNVYSIWDTNMYPTSPQNCDAKSKASVAISYTQNILATARKRIKQTTGGDHNPIWVGENGWSSPMPQGHPLFPFCKQYDSMETFKAAYEAFMNWDLSLPGGLTGPEFAFYFTMRNAFNGGAQEHFGLIDRCEDANCKIYTAKSVAHSNFTMEQPPDFIM
eukprot:CAMPEP_0172674536 /NCGR_PEP_ID=MMETSP1074-20121228/12786_1 /TAXON_ID=2916 /ORGANISM="Ceratium fusus, Strain PA161109" /LENGTH=382 /DNA_ID=CAMNT_0013491949 /DNA_START=156 /DNA_END=1304 /DNA_ORIENTATION=+